MSGEINFTSFIANSATGSAARSQAVENGADKPFRKDENKFVFAQNADAQEANERRGLANKVLGGLFGGGLLA